MLALVSAEGTDDPDYMNDSNALHLMLGQRAVTEQTGPLFAKYVSEIRYHRLSRDMGQTHR